MNLNTIIVKSPVMQEVYKMAEQVARSSLPILLLGETGTGKEVLARYIHSISGKPNDFIVVLCGCLRGDIVLSELFGHEEGAFTGANKRRIGKFEMANGGTIFMDEIEDLPLEVQAMVLRVLEYKEITRVGGTKPIILDNIRIIAGANIDLEEKIRKNEFRRDLFYRLNVFPIKIPPLRERKEDILLLTNHFIAKHGKEGKVSIKGVSQEVIDCFMGYHWPGNVRELENVIRRAIILSKSSIIALEDIPSHIKDSCKMEVTQEVGFLDEEEKTILEFVKTNGKIAKRDCAKLLRKSLRTAFNRLQKLCQKKSLIRMSRGAGVYYTFHPCYKAQSVQASI